MLLFREVYAWLRYLIAKDPICVSQGIIAEEIYSPYAPFSDVTDGVRTLVVHRIQDGLTPRIEMRFISLRPQIYLVKDAEARGELLTTTNTFGFPGEYKNWDTSDTCNYFLALIYKHLCECPMPEKENTGFDAPINPTNSASNPVTAAKELTLPTVHRIVDAVKRAIKTGKKITSEMINDFLRKSDEGDFADFGFSILKWFDKGKILWKDIEVLQDEIDMVSNAGKGKHIFEWSWLKRNLNTPERLDKLPIPIAEQVQASTSIMAETIVQKRFEDIIKRYLQGKSLSASTPNIRFGISALTHFKNGTIALPFLQQLEICDPSEKILPWSYIRRSVLSYNNKVTAEDENYPSLDSLVIQWLKDSHLLLPLYKGDAEQQDALAKTIAIQIKSHIEQTLENKSWLKALLSALIGVKEGIDLKRALQVDFDLWLLDALAPAVDRWKIPLSPHAFAIEKKDQSHYDLMFNAWVSKLRVFLQDYRSESSKILSEALENFFGQVIGLWNSDALKNYVPKIPSVSKILDAVCKGDRESLLQILIEDFESEVGVPMDAGIKDQLLHSIFFNSICREVGLQALRLD